MVTWWAAWQDYSGCVLGTEIVNITDPITGVVLGTSGTCTFIATADQWVRYYLQRTSSGANYTPPFVTEAAPDLMIDGHYWDCTYASAIMLINKITYGALDVSTQTQVRNIIYYWRNTMGNPPGTATNAAKYIWPGADQIYKIEFGKGVTSWSQLLTWLDDGNGAELMGYYSAWNKNSPWSQYPADVGDTPFANETSSASGHAIYLDHRDAATGQIFVMDPLGHGSYAGEYLPDAAVEAFATTVDPIAGSSMGTPASLYVYLGEDTVPGWTIPADQKNPYWTPPGQLVGAPGSYATPSVDEAKTYLLDQLGDREAACASRIFQQESSWRPTAANPASDIPTGAYGIPQAKPKTKLGTWAAQMAASATGGGDYTSAAAYEDWELNPVVQVQWGIGYMNNRYGSACTAAAFKFGGVGDNGVTYPGTGWY